MGVRGDKWARNFGGVYDLSGGDSDLSDVSDINGDARMERKEAREGNR